MSEYEDDRHRRKEHARRSSRDQDASREHRVRDVDLGSAVGKRALTDGIAGGYTVADAIAFFDRTVGELRAQIAALDRAAASGDRILAATAAGSFQRCFSSARGHLANVPAAGIVERQRLLAELELDAEHVLHRAHDAEILGTWPRIGSTSSGDRRGPRSVLPSLQLRAAGMPTAREEVQNGLFYFKETFYPIIPKLYGAIQEEIRKKLPNETADALPSLDRKSVV